MNRALAPIPLALLATGLVTTGCATVVYQPLRSLQRPVMVSLDEANFEGLHVLIRCPAGPFAQAGDAQRACRKVQQVFSNQGAVIDSPGSFEQPGLAKPDLIIDIESRLLSDETDRLLGVLCIATYTLVPWVTDTSFTEDITIRDGDGTLLVADSLPARFVTYTGAAVWAVNALLDVFARPPSDRLSGDAQFAVFSQDFYAQLSQLAFHARTRALVLRNFERPK